MKILFVDNHSDFVRTVRKAFLADHEVTVESTVEGARQAAAAVVFDVAMVDYDLDDGKGDAFVAWLRENQPNVPIVAVSSHDQGNAALLRAGALTTCAKLDFRRIGDVLLEVAGGA